MDTWVVAAVAVGMTVLVMVGLSVRVVQQYEKGVQFRLGRLHGVREPGGPAPGSWTRGVITRRSAA